MLIYDQFDIVQNLPVPCPVLFCCFLQQEGSSNKVLFYETESEDLGQLGNLKKSVSNIWDQNFWNNLVSTCFVELIISANCKMTFTIKARFCFVWYDLYLFGMYISFKNGKDLKFRQSFSEVHTMINERVIFNLISKVSQELWDIYSLLLYLRIGA